MSFYPPGWDYDHLLNGPPDDLLKQLAEREPRAPYISPLKVLFRWREPEEWSGWGYVVFRAGQYGGEHEEQWAEFRQRWDLIFEQDFAEYRGFHLKSDRAIELFKFRWVEDPTLEMADPKDISRRFEEMRNDLPRAFATTACLMVTPEVIDSVLDSPLPSSAPEPERQMLPFAIAVSVWAHREQPVSFKGYFRVAVESLIHGFYAIVALDTTHLSELVEPMRDDCDIWLDSGGDGIRYHDGIPNPPKRPWAALFEFGEEGDGDFEGADPDNWAIFLVQGVNEINSLAGDDTRNQNPTRAVAIHQNIVFESFQLGLSHQRDFPLLWALHGAFKFEFWLAGIAMLFANLLQVMAPLLLRYFLVSLSDESSSHSNSLTFVALLFTTQMGMSFALVHYHYLGGVVGSQVKAVLTAMVFEKSLRLSNNESNEWTDGKISNLITVDSQRIQSALLYANMIWSEPVAVIVALTILFYNLTWSALSGLLLLGVGAKGLEFSMGWLMSRRMAINAAVDLRILSLLEGLRNMKFVKFHAWEPYFLRQISDVREAEFQQQHKLLSLQSTIMSLSTSLPSYAAMLSFIIFATIHGGLTAAETFSSLALFNCLRKPLNILPMVLNQLIDAWVSLQRIESFFMAEDEQKTIEWDFNAANVIEITNGYFSWNYAADGDILSPKINEETSLLSVHEESNMPGSKISSLALSNVNLQVKPGELIAVAGPVGAGKSALLLALAGQMSQTRGHVVLGATRSFCSQVPWIESGTVQENILFGKPLLQPWYDEVVEACALKPDLKTWEYGDATYIGEQGITLSGGQKQRLSLARTIYADTDLLLLDDPLSAVDADVGQHIFNKAILGLLRGKTCILVTHQTHIITQCDRVLWLEKGHIKASESLSNPSSGDEMLSHLIPTQENYQQKHLKNAEHGGLSNEDHEAVHSTQDQNMVIDSETQKSGRVHGSVYKTYLSASGSIFHWPILFFLLIVSQIAGIFTGVWLSWWVDNTLGWDNRAYILGCILFGVAHSVLAWVYLRQASFTGLRASDNLFKAALQRVLYAPMSFHTANPAGRLMNLFSSDVNQLDNGVSGSVQAFFLLVGIAFSTFLLISVQFPLFVLSLPVIALVVSYTSAYYRASRQELKRFETVSRSTVAGNTAECIAGRQTIRSFGVQQNFQSRLGVAIDEASNFSYLMSASQQWLNLRLDTLGNILILFVGALIVMSDNSIPASMSGLLMTYALAVVQIIPGIVSQTAEIENSFITVERMIHYGNEIPTEMSVSATVPPSTWPETGTITMKNVSLRYQSNHPQALQDVSLTINDGEKVGIIGRTGAGKSSIVSVLFRLFPLEYGSVVIDNMDIANLNLHSLRPKLAIIPQDPTLFQGTVRTNLDPSGEYPDDVLCNALRKTNLYPQVHLDREVQPDGKNFSLGERQLLALARVLVRDPRILVCDEATSAVDQDTDRAVQQTLLDAFQHRTVICIAHRLQTIIRYDRICMVDQGKVVDFQSPLRLFDTNAEFRQMCELNHITRKDIV
ncbi:ABC transporter, integral membrane type 1 [Penicillium expansum]|nr:ABC transporter, integral membrane type 1 [Penicillium expansum]